MTPENQLLLTLSFYSNGSFLQVCGDFCGVSKSTASKTVKRVSSAIAARRHHYIRMPDTENEIREMKQKFFQIAHFPHCIGAVDCTHVRILSPGGDNAESFRNRKNFFSLNVQTIADADLKIRNIVARYPGSAHDSRIFRNSRVCHLLENGHFGDSLIVGDSGYRLTPYLLTPLLQTTNEAEALYNESLIRTRNVVERSYGIWKRRFPALAMGLRVKLETTQAVIVASAILHNIACDKRINIPPIDNDQEAAINLVNNVNMQALRNIGGVNNITRINLINNYFGRL